MDYSFLQIGALVHFRGVHSEWAERNVMVVGIITENGVVTDESTVIARTQSGQERRASADSFYV